MIRESGPAIDPEAIAITALGWLAEDRARMGRFLMLTGLRGDTLRQQVAEPGFLREVLRQIVGWEPWLIEFAATANLRPADIVAAADAEPPRPA